MISPTNLKRLCSYPILSRMVDLYGGRLFAPNDQLAAFGRLIISLPSGGKSAASWDRPLNAIIL